MKRGVGRVCPSEAVVMLNDRQNKAMADQLTTVSKLRLINRPVAGRELDIRKCPLELAMTSATYPSPASCAGNRWAGRLKLSGSLSQMRDLPSQNIENLQQMWYNDKEQVVPNKCALEVDVWGHLLYTPGAFCVQQFI